MIGIDHGNLSTPFDNHVGQGHPVFNGHFVNRWPVVFQGVSFGKIGPVLGNQGHHDVLCKDSRCQVTSDMNAQVLWLHLPEGLGRKDVLDFRSPNPKGQGPQPAVGRRMGIPTNDQLSWLG